MTSCETIHDLLTSYLLGDLPSERADLVREHLETCERCRADAQSIEPTLELLRDALAAPAGPRCLSSAQRLSVLRDAKAPRARVLEWATAYRPQLVAAAASLLVMCLFSFT